MQRQQGSTRQDYPWARTPFWQKETIQERSVYVAASRDFISWRPKPSLFTRDAPLYFNNQPYLIAMVARREMGYQTMFLNILYDIISFGSDFFAPDTTFWIKNQFSANYQHVNTPTLYLVWKKAANEAPQVRVNGRSLEPSWWNPTYVSVPDNTYTTLTIGDRAGNNQRLEGRLYEIMVLTGPLKEPHHRIIEGYLAWKWGLEKSLPRRHPYYRVPPGK
jgi:hypothetical protein